MLNVKSKTLASDLKAVLHILGFLIYAEMLRNWLSAPAANGAAFFIWSLACYLVPPRYHLNFVSYVMLTATHAYFLFLTIGALEFR